MRDDVTDRLVMIMTAVPSDLEWGEFRTVDCPCCMTKKGLYVSRSDYNGHLFVRCDMCDFTLMQ